MLMDEVLHETIQLLQAQLARKSKPLTEQQILDLGERLHCFPPDTRCDDIVLFARAIEAIHGVK
jgi:hypothetical protein